MCGRYLLKSSPSEVSDEFEVDVRDNFPPRYNIAPTQPIAVIHVNEQRQPAYHLMRWGFIPEWAKKDYLDRMGSKPLINARSETVAEKPTFRAAYKRRRCLIPADGFYEWRAQGDVKQPYHITREGLFGFAGIWETAIGPDGGEADTCAILTTASGPDLKTLHHREPIVIAREHYHLWLTADERDLEMLEDLLRPALKDTWVYHPVSRDVGSPRNDGPQLVQPVAL